MNTTHLFHRIVGGVKARAALAAACLAALAPLARAAGPNADHPDRDTDPAYEQAHLKVANGFEIHLFASDPMVQKPIEMNFDAAGRLWVASSETYPQVKPGQTPNDKVIVLEDTTGSGKADRATDFAGGLLIPTGIAPGDGGCYVANSTEIDFFKNTAFHNQPGEAVGKANFRRVVLAGFGTEDTHHIVHAFRWGPDGRLYFNQSIYIHSALETPSGTKRLYGGGVWRFEPSTMDLSVFVTGLVNGWGDAWDRWGNAFGTDGAGGEGINYFIPGAAFTATPGAARVLPGLNKSQPKYCSLAVLSGRGMPASVQGDLITNDFRANRIVRFRLSDAGAGFEATLQPNLVTSTDKSFRPIDVKMGPDGALYVADWYNPIIQHGEVDFRDPRRDHVHGRIWRITAKGLPRLPRPQLVGAPIERLLDSLLEPEQWTRQQARQVLRERPVAEVAPALGKWVRALDKRGLAVDALEHAKLEALWTYECVDTVEPKLLDKLLHSPDANARAAAALVVSNWAPMLPDAMQMLAPLVSDENPRVRLMAVRALAAVGTPEAVPLATRVLDKPMDPFLDYALYKTCTDLEPIWLPAFKAGKLSDWAGVNHLTYALQAVKSPDALRIVVGQLKSGELPAESRQGVFDLIASVGAPPDVAEMLEVGALSGKSDAASTVAALSAADRAARQRHVVPEPTPAPGLAGLIGSNDPDVAAAAARYAGAIRLVAALPELERRAAAVDAPIAPRVASVGALAEVQGAEAGAFLEKLAAPANPPAVRAGGIIGLTRLDLPRAAKLAAGWLASAPADADRGAVIAAFLHKEGGPDALAAELERVKLSPDDAKLSLRYLQSIGQDAPRLSELLKKDAGLAIATKALSPEEMKQLMADVLAHGDAARGQLIFRSKTVGCYQCHAIAGAGGTLAPDLRSIGASAPLDYIINSVLLPNKDIKDGYDSIIVATKDGDLIQGIRVREDAKELVLKDNTRDEIPIPQDQIKTRRDGGSLMPSGLADALTHQEFLDLIRFVSDLGRPGPYAVPDAPYVRRWRVLDAVPTSLAGATAAFPTGDRLAWAPVYSLVSGELPLASIAGHSPTHVEFVQFQVDAGAGGKARLAFNSTAGLTAWLDGQPMPLGGANIEPELAKGLQTVTLRVASDERNSKGIEVEVSDVPGSAAHAVPVGGK